MEPVEKKTPNIWTIFELPNFDDGRTSNFIYSIGEFGKTYTINTVLDLFLHNVLAKK